ncbi:MAG: ABC transporter ATP-binding protein [Chitinispirillales bacterium]|jgi:phospholipid/cholesterol/gamma-HCH transport system ATP-binding protein|nr:ABC transporter ATP-binding protein [Chitinispirillales bacterium]
MLRVEHLKKHFGNQVVLDDINISVDRGEVLCVIGQSGSGKTVLFRHIIGLMFPDGGRILLDGQVISSPTTKTTDFDRVRKRFGILFQGAALFDSMDVGENLAFPLREHTDLTEREIERLIGESLEMVGLKEQFKAKMPSELSGGMRSRVGLARAIVMKPEIMLYDEPTSALDPIMTDKINKLILSMREKLKMTSIVITHDIGSAYEIADKIAMIREGKIIFNGTPGEIRQSRNPYVQEFIRGERKSHYALDNEEDYASSVDITKLKQRSARPRQAVATQQGKADGSTGNIAEKKFQMPPRPTTRN